MSNVAQDRRLSHRPGEADSPRIEHVDGAWRIRSAQAVRQILRDRDATKQAGFNIEAIPDGAMEQRPILFMDGEDHRQQRSKIARYFAPKTVSTRYRTLMEERADALVAEMVDAPTFRLDDVSLRFSTEVAAQVIGLTNSNIKGMSRRLERLFDQPAFDPLSGMTENKLQWTIRNVRAHAPMVAFYVADVRPAIAARRKKPGEDVISHLLAEGYKEWEILIECVTYGAAGMVTTREFISMATLHLIADADLRARYLAGDEAERYDILHEILRLEPIVGHLYRRAQRELTFTDGDQTYTVAAGEFLDLFIRQANSDADTVGECPLDLRPGRTLPRGIGPEVMSFGDGPHKCPGNSLAIQESDILLSRLLRHELVVAQAPTLGWDDIIAGYSLRGFLLTVPKSPLPGLA